MPNSHGTAHRYDDGCRCEPCVTAKRAKNKRQVEVAHRRLEAGDPTIPHGSHATYSQFGCRCDLCRKAATEKGRKWREKNPGRHAEHTRKWREKNPDYRDPTPRDHQHGTTTGYAYGCRCVACSHAWGEQTKAGDRRRQAETRLTAEKAGQLWTGAELEIVVTRTDLPITELAKMLGRTYQAVTAARRRATSDPKWIAVVGVGKKQQVDPRRR